MGRARAVHAMVHVSKMGFNTNLVAQETRLMLDDKVIQIYIIGLVEAF